MPASPLPTKIGVLIFPGFQLLDLAGPLDALIILSTITPLQISVIASSLTPLSTQNHLQTAVGSNAALTLTPTHTFETAPADLEMLLVPGGPGSRGGPDGGKAAGERMAPIVEWLRGLGLAGGKEGGLRWVLTVCTGSEILARTGVLEGRRATTNKRAFNEVKGLHPTVNWVSKARWVVDGNIWTSSGISAGIDLTFAWMAEVWGDEMAQEVADRSEYERNVEPGNDRYAERWGAV